ncbi:MAG: hypothetical protein A2Y56_09215 [Candidatus Aminicenantes bacterium RBG_13_63_10]|nr:MAG: hypothetical protein A2Y56_09215 [Candidatus Aminicenantes bacterium RBG_13_63_10]
MTVGLGLLFLCCGSAPLSASLNISVSHYQLKNGLQVILSEDFTLPLISVAVTYKAGSLHDPPGKSGLAYLIENLMFLGSDNVGQMQHIGYVTRTGGTLNAATMADRTIFYQTVPSNQLALVLWLESDRMKSLQVSPAKVEAAKNELLSELRRRHQETPYLEAFFRFDRMLFPAPAAHRPIIGLEEDIKSITYEDAQNFHRQRYGPQNALLCVTGSFNTLQLRDLVNRYFESIPRSHDTLPPPVLPEPDKTSGMETSRAASIPAPSVLVGFRIHSARAVDMHVLTLIDYILCRGKTSRLVQRTIKRDRLASQITGSLERRGDLAAYRIFAVNNSEYSARLCVGSIYSELARMRTNFISEEELNRAKNRWKKDLLNRLSSRADKALFLSELALNYGDPRAGSLDIGRFQEVTPLMIAGLLNRYFYKENSQVLYILK